MTLTAEETTRLEELRALETPTDEEKAELASLEEKAAAPETTEEATETPEEPAA